MKSHASMNRIYRLVFNAALGVWVAVAENARGKGKGGRTATALLAVLAVTGSAAYAADAGDATIRGGAGSVATLGNTTTIHQVSQRLAIDWTKLSTGANEALVFSQPNAQAIALNRITGSASSSFMGSITANGQVFILNPNGVLFGAGSQVNVGGIVASTLGMNPSDFMAGSTTFTKTTGTGSVVNQGRMTAAQGGYLALLAPEVRNEGVMTAALGTALLAAGNKVTLNLNNGSLLSYSIDQGAINALAENKQLIKADGGQVLLSAKALDALTTATVNNTGIIEARTIQNIAGRIMLMGDMESGTVNVGGVLDASAPSNASNAGVAGNGGFVETSAAKVEVANGAIVTTKALAGQTGAWLLDPTDFKIAASGGNMTGASLGSQLENNNVTLATFLVGTGNGDMLINDSVTWSSNNSLTLNAQRNIDFNGGGSLNASGTTGSVTLNAGQGSTGSIIGHATNTVVTANTLVVTAKTGVGSPGASLLTQVANAALTNTSSGGVHMTNAGKLTVAASSVNGDLSIKTVSAAVGTTGGVGSGITVDTVGTLVGLVATGADTGGNISLVAGAGGVGAAGNAFGAVGIVPGTGGRGGAININAAVSASNQATITAGVGGAGGFGDKYYIGAPGGTGGDGGDVTMSATVFTAQTAKITAGSGGAGGLGGYGGRGGSGGGGGAVNMNAALAALQAITVAAGGGGIGGVGGERGTGAGGGGGNGGGGGAVNLNAAVSTFQAATFSAGNGGIGSTGGEGSTQGGYGGNGGDGGVININASMSAKQALAVNAGAGGNGSMGGYGGVAGGGGGSGGGGSGGGGGRVNVNAAVAAAQTATIASGVGGAGNSAGSSFLTIYVPPGNAGTNAVIAGTAIDITAGTSLKINGAIAATKGNIRLNAGSNAGNTLDLRTLSGQGEFIITTASGNVTLQAERLSTSSAGLSVNAGTGSVSLKQLGTSRDFVLANVNAGSLSIDSAGLEARLATAAAKDYDGTRDAFVERADVSGLRFTAGNNLSVVLATNAAFDTPNVGNKKEVIAEGFSITGYSGTAQTLLLKSGSQLQARTQANINRREVVLTGMTAADRDYDGTRVATLIGGSVVTGVVGETLSFSGATGLFASANAGSQAVTVVQAALVNGSGGVASNYVLARQPVVAAATIATKVLTVTANDDTRTPGRAAYSGGNGITHSALAAGDTLNGVVAGAVTYGGTSQGATALGNYAITPGGLTPASANYTLRFANGVLTIAAAPGQLLTLVPRPPAVPAPSPAPPPAPSPAPGSGAAPGSSSPGVVVAGFSPAAAQSVISNAQTKQQTFTSTEERQRSSNQSSASSTTVIVGCGMGMPAGFDISQCEN